MAELIVGSEALAAGMVTRQMLRSRYVKVHYNVYAPVGFAVGVRRPCHGGMAWSSRKAVVAGNSAAALLGTRWIPAGVPAELARVRQPAPPGIVVHSGALAPDEIIRLGDIDCTTAARTAYDLCRRLSPDTGIIRMDALMNATGCTGGPSCGPVSRRPRYSSASHCPGVRGRRCGISSRNALATAAGARGSALAPDTDPGCGPTPPQSSAHRHGLARMAGRRRV